MAAGGSEATNGGDASTPAATSAKEETPVKEEPEIKEPVEFPKIPGTTLSLRVLDGASSAPSSAPRAAVDRRARSRAFFPRVRIRDRRSPSPPLARSERSASSRPRASNPRPSSRVLVATARRPPRADERSRPRTHLSLAEFEIRDKRDEGKVVGLEQCRTKNVVVFGKARKVEGGESSRPKDVLKRALKPVNKPPHPLKLSEVLDWTVCYDERRGPSVWLVTLRAWYRLGEPAEGYKRAFATLQRRVAFCDATLRAIRRDWNVSVEDGLAALTAVPVVSGDYLSPKFRGAVAANEAAAAKAAVESGVKGGKKGASKPSSKNASPAVSKTTSKTAAGSDSPAAAASAAAAAAAAVTELKYARRDVINDTAFIAQQLEGLRKAGALVDGAELSVPPLIKSYATLLETTRTRERAEARAASKAAQQKALRTQSRFGAGGAGGARQAGAGGASMPPPPPRNLPPRETRSAPPAAGLVVPESYGTPPALLAETLALWDLTQVHGAFLRLPPCPWERFSRAFLGPPSTSGINPADAALVRDVCVAVLRVAEGGGGDKDATEPPPDAKRIAEMSEEDDLRMLDWSERALAVLTMYDAGEKPTWPCAAVKIGAFRATHALVKAIDAATASVGLPAGDRVALASALAAIMCEAESWHDYLFPKLELAMRAQKDGELPLGPRKVKAKTTEAPLAQPKIADALAAKPAPGGDEKVKVKTESSVVVAGEQTSTPTPTPKTEAEAGTPASEEKKPEAAAAAEEKGAATSDAASTEKKDETQTQTRAAPTRPEWADTLVEWVAKAGARSTYLRSRAIATDETGRKYYTLGGAAGAGLIFTQEPSATAFQPDDDVEEDAKKDALPAAEVKEEGAAPSDDADAAEETPEQKAAKRAESKKEKAQRTSALSKANIAKGKAYADALHAAETWGECPTRWSVFTIGPRLKELKDWLDDDPRNPKSMDERRLKAMAALLMRTAPKAKDEKADAADADAAKDAAKDAAATADVDWFKELGLVKDGYVKLDPPPPDPNDAWGAVAMNLGPTREQNRAAAATALCAVVRSVLSGSSKFWNRPNNWLHAMLNLCSALPDALGTGLDSVASGDRAGDRLAVLVSRVLPPLEAMLRSSHATTEEWLDRREAWFTGLRGAEDFDLRIPPEKLMTWEEAEETALAHTEIAQTAIEWSTTDEAIQTAMKLGTARSARLLGVLCSALVQDDSRMNSAKFFSTIPTATHAGIKTCEPGNVVALMRKGMKLTRERYIGVGNEPEGWIPLKELRPVERAVVRAWAFRDAVPPPPDLPGYSGTPPCCWVLLELLDEPALVAGRGRRNESSPGGGREAGPRLISAPIYAGAEVADYIVDWDKYSASAEKPWSKGARIMMFFPDINDGEGPQEDALGRPADVVAAVAGGGAPPPATPKPKPTDGEATPMDVEDGATPNPDAADANAAPVGVIKLENGAEYWLGRVNRVKHGDDPWESVQVIFDSDPDGDDPMWVCPWEIENAPAEYQDEVVPNFPNAAGDDGMDDEERTEANQKKVEAGRAIAERLGWPQGVNAARVEFEKFRAAAAGPGGVVPKAPIFCHAELDLYRVLVEVMCLGGSDLVTEEKRWKQVARTLGKDLTKQTSASFAMRSNFQKALVDVEAWLWDNAHTLGERPEAYNTLSSTPVGTPAKAPLVFKAKADVLDAVDEGDNDDDDDDDGDGPTEEEYDDDDDDGAAAAAAKKGGDDDEFRMSDDADEDDDDGGGDDDSSDDDFSIRPNSASKKRKQMD